MDEQLTLFNALEQALEPIITKNIGKPRIVAPCRNQYEMRHSTLDELLPKDHLARDVWHYVEGLDLSIVLRKIEAIEGNVGRPATDPKILLSLWVYATIKSISSARMIEEYCNEHDAFKWICGGVNVNYHTISDFRSKHGDQLTDLLIQSVALLSKNGIISLERVSQDGMRVRANAGAASFRREATLEAHLMLATDLLEDLKNEAERNPGQCRTRVEAAERRAAEEKVRNIKSAQAELQKVMEEKKARAKKDRKKIGDKDLEKTRASMTDPEARIMKMACGGFRPAYNVQFVSTNKGKAIIAVDVNKQGADNGQIVKMIERVKTMHGKVPRSWLVDGGYKSGEQLDIVEERYESCKIYMPVETKGKEDPYKRHSKDSKAVGEWRERMGTEEAKEQYKERAATAEYSNAQSRNKGLQQFRVRGVEKVNCVAMLFALVHNITIFLNNQ